MAMVNGLSMKSPCVAMTHDTAKYCCLSDTRRRPVSLNQWRCVVGKKDTRDEGVSCYHAAPTPARIAETGSRPSSAAGREDPDTHRPVPRILRRGDINSHNLDGATGSLT